MQNEECRVQNEEEDVKGFFLSPALILHSPFCILHFFPTAPHPALSPEYGGEEIGDRRPLAFAAPFPVPILTHPIPTLQGTSQMLPTSTNVTVDVKAKPPAGSDAVAVFVVEGSKDAGESGAALAEGERRAVERLLSAGVSRGKAREVHFDLIEGPGQGKQKILGYRRVLVVGLGPAGKLGSEAVRQAAAALAKAAKKQRLRDVAVVLPDLHRGGDASPATGPAATAEAIATGILLAGFSYEEYKGSASKKKADDEQGAAARLRSSPKKPGWPRRERGRARAGGGRGRRTSPARSPRGRATTSTRRAWRSWRRTWPARSGWRAA